MAGSDDEHRPGIPAWQQAHSSGDDTTSASDLDQPSATTLEQARKFLQDDEVRGQSRARKMEFLKSKGLAEEDVEALLREDANGDDSQPEESNAEERTDETPPQQTRTSETQNREAARREDRPPIITYPEYLTKPQKPPPLITVQGVLNSLYAFAGVSTLVYGTAQYVVGPMVESLTEARLSLHEHAGEKLAQLVAKLEDTVSEIPPTIGRAEAVPRADADDDDDSSYDDPTEMFHRDVGVQTSLPASPGPAGARSGSHSPGGADGSPSVEQARRLAGLVASVRSVSEGLVLQSEDYVDIKGTLGQFREELDKLSYQPADYIGGGSMLYGFSSKNEPDDEIKHAKENIRRLKGVLLSTRSFPR